jgi:hypothetical protein
MKVFHGYTLTWLLKFYSLFFKHIQQIKYVKGCDIKKDALLNKFSLLVNICPLCFLSFWYLINITFTSAIFTIRINCLFIEYAT